MHVLLGVGGSTDSTLALHETLERIGKTEDTLTIAILENPDAAPSVDDIEATVVEALEAHDVKADIVRLSGEPGPALAAYAESKSFDRIVLGGGARSPMGKIAIGRIAEFVLLNADTSITLIR